LKEARGDTVSTQIPPENLDELSQVLLDVITLAKAPELTGQYQDISSLRSLYDILISMRDFLYAASSGDLSVNVPHKGFIPGAMKTLQANLKHMSWQTKMIASGDFTQRIDFMGEFSESFNMMVTQLDQTLKELVEKKDQISKANDELRKEIDIRIKTEQALRQSQKALKRLATTDALTGLFNRRHFTTLAENEISRALRYGRRLSIIMFDIDFFKKVNDTYGHANGDEVLKAVAKTTQNSIRSTDIAARYGGEEFIILLPETPKNASGVMAERLRKSIEELAIQTDKETIRITASFGIYGGLENGEKKPIETLLSEGISKADQALYDSKENGRNRVTVYEE